MLSPLKGGFGQPPLKGGSVLFFFLPWRCKDELGGGLPPLCRPLFMERGFGLTKEVAKLLLAPSWGTDDGLVLEDAMSWSLKLSKTSEASWEETVSGTLNAKGGRVNSPLRCASSSLTLPPWPSIPVIHFRSDSALLNGETLCTIWDIFDPTLSVAFNLK